MIVTIPKCFVPKSWINYAEGYTILVWINSILESLLGGEDDDYVKRESAFDHIYTIDNHHATLTKTVNDIWWFKLCCEDGEDECHEDVYSFIHMPEAPTPSSADIEESLVMDTDNFNYSPDDSFNWDLQNDEINWNLQDDDSITEAFDAAADLNGSDIKQTVIPLQFGGKPQSFISSGNREPWGSSSSSTLSSSLSSSSLSSDDIEESGPVIREQQRELQRLQNENSQLRDDLYNHQQYYLYQGGQIASLEQQVQDLLLRNLQLQEQYSTLLQDPEIDKRAQKLFPEFGII